MAYLRQTATIRVIRVPLPLTCLAAAFAFVKFSEFNELAGNNP